MAKTWKQLLARDRQQEVGMKYTDALRQVTSEAAELQAMGFDPTTCGARIAATTKEMAGAGLPARRR